MEKFHLRIAKKLENTGLEPKISGTANRALYVRVSMVSFKRTQKAQMVQPVTRRNG
jgi:hypothetical protein